MFARTKLGSTHAAVAMALGATLGIGSIARANDWTTPGYDAGRARATDEKSGAAFVPAWNANPSGGAIVASPLVTDGFVIVTGKRGDVSALRATDGQAVWSVMAAGNVAASPTIDQGRIFLPTLAGQVQALRLGNGAEVWKRAVGGSNYASPVLLTDSLGAGLVFGAGFPAQKVVRLKATTGETQWETAPGAVGGLVGSPAALAGDQILFGMNGGRYQTVDPLTGETKWKADTKGAVGLSAPLVVAGTAYFVPGGTSSGLYAANAATGELLADWPVAVADASAPDKAIVMGTRHAVSSPARFGTLVTFVERFEYDLFNAKTNAPGDHVLREFVVAVDPATHQLAWQQELGTVQVASMNDIPELNLAPTPASFATETDPLLVVASSVVAKLRVFDVGGKEVWTGDLSAPTRSSPVLANGLILVATDTGVVNAFASTVNHAPVISTDGFSPAEGETVDEPAPTLKWNAATDAEAGALTYQVRLAAADGNVRETWLKQLTSEPGASSVAVDSGTLTPGLSYRYAVRARDAAGAWSDWSEERSFFLSLPASIDVGGKSYPTLADAIAAVSAEGGVVNIGRGLVRLRAPLVIPSGVTVQGAGPSLTILDATGQRAGVQIQAAGRTGVPSLKNVSVMGADVGISVIDVQNAVLRNVVVRDNKKLGIEIEDGAAAEAINVTIARNPTGASVAGKLGIRSSIVTANDKGLLRAGAGVVTSRYNDVFANTTTGYDGVAAGTGDIAVAVRFRSEVDFHLSGFQPSTDRGDPADAYDREPQPNGARVNMGAFGNTSTAELSPGTGGWTPVANAPLPETKVPVGSATNAPGASASPMSDPTSTPTTPHSGGSGGCSVAGGSGGSSSLLGWLTVALCAVFASRRRRT